MRAAYYQPASVWHHCKKCAHAFTEPEDGPVYCGACKARYPGIDRSGIDSEKRDDNYHAGLPKGETA